VFELIAVGSAAVLRSVLLPFDRIALFH